MTLVSDYLARAIDAETKARKATGVPRAQMLAVAEQWRELARQALELDERQERLQREPPSPTVRQ
jgi:hypothetical protein